MAIRACRIIDGDKDIPPFVARRMIGAWQANWQPRVKKLLSGKRVGTFKVGSMHHMIQRADCRHCTIQERPDK